MQPEVENEPADHPLPGSKVEQEAPEVEIENLQVELGGDLVEKELPEVTFCGSDPGTKATGVEYCSSFSTFCLGKAVEFSTYSAHEPGEVTCCVGDSGESRESVEKGKGNAEAMVRGRDRGLSGVGGVDAPGAG
jgi:hypothetical protein